MEQIIKDNMGLVYKQLHKFGLAYNDDAISYCMEALWRAAETFDSSNGTKFSTYASSCIYNAIMLYFRDSSKEQQCLSYEELCGKNRIEDRLMSYSVQEENYILELIAKLYSELTNDSHRKVIAYWYDSDFKATQSEIAAEYNLSQSHVSRILSAFKNKLKEEIICKKQQE